GDFGKQLIEHFLVEFLTEKLDRRIGNRRADAADGEQIRISRRRRVLIRRRERAAQGGEAEVIARQQPGIALTDVAYAEGIDETIERNFPPAVDRIKEILRRLLAEPFTVLDPCQVARRSIARLQREDIGRRADQPILVKGIDQLGAEPLDIKGIARDEMLQ